jgi:glycosyltransferase involved in cell wall biosynthesis
MLSKPTITIGLPVYNGENFLRAAIESVLSQDFEDFELIISDNASQDGTAAMCERYAAADKRIRYHRCETNNGGAWNYNRVFELATGKYFKWQAHDDVCLPGFFRRCVEVFDQAPPSVVVVYPRTAVIDEEGKLIPTYHPESLETKAARPHDRLAFVLRSMSMVCAQFGLIRPEALRKTRLFDRMIAADWVLMAELAMLGEFWEVPETLFHRRVHPGISTKANRDVKTLLQWWDPSRKSYGSFVSPMMRLGWEYLRSIRQMPLEQPEKLFCYATALSVWYIRQFRNFGGRYKRRLFRPAGVSVTG